MESNLKIDDKLWYVRFDGNNSNILDPINLKVYSKEIGETCAHKDGENIITRVEFKGSTIRCHFKNNDKKSYLTSVDEIKYFFISEELAKLYKMKLLTEQLHWYNEKIQLYKSNKKEITDWIFNNLTEQKSW